MNPCPAGWRHVSIERLEDPLIPALLALLLTPSALAGDPPGAPGHRYGPPRTPVVGVAPGMDPFEWQTTPPVLLGTREETVELRLKVPPGFVVYRDQLAVRVLQTRDLVVGEVHVPPGITRLDPGRDEVAREQYDHDVVITLPVQSATGEPGLAGLRVYLRHQGCYGGHCFRPVEQVVAVHVPVRLEPEGQAPVGAGHGGTRTPGTPSTASGAAQSAVEPKRIVMVVAE